MRILVVAEFGLARALQRSLEPEGFQVDTSTTGEDGFCRLTESDFTLAIIDEVLPIRGGFWVINHMRGVDIDIPVVILSEKDSVEDRVKGLNSGADDYIVKPFAFPELMARIRTVLRRGRGNGGTTLRVGDLEMNLVTRKVTRNDTAITLTLKEFSLLAYLMRNPGMVVTRQALAREIWNINTDIVCANNILDVHMTRLRRKIDSRPPAIATVRGMGFIMKSSTT